MPSVALCMHCERWIPVPLWRNYKMVGKSECAQPWLFESVVTHSNHKWALIAGERNSA